MSQSTIVGAVEIGTAKVVAVIGEILDNKSLSIIGMGESPSQGVKKGEVVDFKAASMATHRALLTAEESAGVRLTEVYLSQTGGHVTGFFNEASVNVSSSNNCVRKEDIDRVTTEAKNKELTKDRVYIHHIQNPFELDGRKIANPLGMVGQKLSVGYWSVHGDLNKVRDHIHIVNGFSLKVKDMIISSVASGSMIADESQKQNGCAVLDIGRGTTDFVLYQGGYVVKTGVIPIGGDHVTNDISLGLRIDHNQAERLKIEFGSACSDALNTDRILIESEGNIGKRYVYRSAINQIIQARIEELFQILKMQVELESGIDQLPGGVIMTGGASRLADIAKVGAEVLGCEVTLGDNPPWACDNLREPEYSTALGLLYCALKACEKDGSIFVKKNGILAKFARILNIG